MKKTYFFPLVLVLALVAAGCGHAVSETETSNSTTNDTPLSVTDDVPTGVVEGDAMMTEGSTTVSINTTDSVVRWAGERVVGNKHTGTFPIKDGALLVKDDQLVGGSVTFDMPNLTVDDGSGVLNHLKTDDFFGVETYPEAMFEVTNITDDTITGNLTLRDITNELSFPATISQTDGVWSVEGTVTIDRTLWDVKYDSITFFSDLADKAIRNEVPITFSLISQ